MVKVAMFPEVIYRFKAISIKIPAVSYTYNGKLNLKFIQKSKGPNIEKDVHVHI